MAKCPVCGKSSTQSLCPECGYNLELDDKMHRLSSQLSRQEIENYQKQIQRLKVIYNNKMKQMSSMVSYSEVQKYKDQLDYQIKQNQILQQKNIQLNRDLSESTSQKHATHQKIQKLQEENKDLEFQNVSLSTQLGLKNAELKTSASQTHINKKDVPYAANIIKNFEVIYVLFVPLIIISSFFAIDILMNFLGKYIIYIDHPVIKIVLHVLISSFGISMFGTNITNMSHWLYQASKGQSVPRNDHLDTENFYLLLFLFGLSSLVSLFMYYYCPMDNDLYSIQYLLALLINLSIIIVYPLLNTDTVDGYYHNRFIFFILTSIVMILAFYFYFHKLWIPDNSLFIKVSYLVIWILSALSLIFPGYYLMNDNKYEEEIFFCPLGITSFSGMYLLGYFVIQWILCFF